MDAEKYIETLKREQAATALEALLRPKGRDAFEFGLACGLVQGYERTLQVLSELQDEADGKVKSKQQPASRSVNPYLADLDSAPLLPEQMGRERRR